MQFSCLEEMTEFIQGAGVDTATFDERSKKTLQDLFEETVTRDVRLDLGDEPGGIKRISMSAKVFIHDDHGCLLEAAREYPNGKRTEFLRLWSMSETVKRLTTGDVYQRRQLVTGGNESPLMAAVRGLKEEFGLHITEKELLWRFNEPLLHPHPSTVYADTISVTTVERFTLRAPRGFMMRDFTVNDCGTRILVQYVTDPTIMQMMIGAYTSFPGELWMERIPSEWKQILRDADARSTAP